MKLTFTLPVAELKPRLTALSQFYNYSTVLPVLTEMLVVISEKAKTITVSMTDLENWGQTTFTGFPCKGEGSALVDFKQLLTFTRNTQSEQITIRIEDQKVSFVDSDFTATLQSEKVDNYPKNYDNKEMKPLMSFKDCADFSNAIKIGIQYVSKDDLRPAMTGAVIQLHEGQVTLAATDAHRLYMHKIKGNETDFIKDSQPILPVRLLRFISNYMKTGEMKISVDDNRILVVDDTYEISSRLIDARFPNWPVVIPQDLSMEFHLERKKIQAMLKLAKPFLNSATNQIVLLLDKEVVEWTGGRSDFDSDDVTTRFTVPAYNSNTVDMYKAAFNAKFLIDTLAHSKDPYVRIKHCGSPTKAIIIDDEFLIMPLMLNE